MSNCDGCSIRGDWVQCNGCEDLPAACTALTAQLAAAEQREREAVAVLHDMHTYHHCFQHHGSCCELIGGKVIVTRRQCICSDVERRAHDLMGDWEEDIGKAGHNDG